MKNKNDIQSRTSKKNLGIALAALLIPAGMASARDAGPAAAKHISGHVEVVRQVPGGVITVGAEWGKRPAPQVVVVKEQPRVIVVERDRHPRHHEREVTVVREHPRRQVTVIHQEPRCEATVIRREPSREVIVLRKAPARRKVVVVEKRQGSDRHFRHGKQISIDHKGKDGQYHYYKDANQVSESKVDRSGGYHYYEDAKQVSIQDNRDGHLKNVYVRK